MQILDGFGRGPVPRLGCLRTVGRSLMVASSKLLICYHLSGEKCTTEHSFPMVLLVLCQSVHLKFYAVLIRSLRFSFKKGTSPSCSDSSYFSGLGAP